MATDKDFCEYVCECLSVAGEITARPMMGEYLVYFEGVLVGDICDNRLLLKQTPTSLSLLGECAKDFPYQGSKTLMIVADNFEDRELFASVLRGMKNDLIKK
ncbi:MAG: competence protein TfoX [Oscillospiraceae bacterium]|nr:competence protein TfoX [Candidatus Equicaccousia limihippi]